MEKCCTISVPEAALRLGIGRVTAYRLALEGSLPALRLGKQLRVPVAALDALLAGQKAAGAGCACAHDKGGA
jgi:excisionase family DNA binding protein